MGRKAKLKKIRQKSPSQSETNSLANETEFVKVLQKQGYTLKEVKRSPDVPETRINPQV